jgi:peptidoglycan/xylan/chitin deacetylase (PgdA/CDA1 family)
MKEITRGECLRILGKAGLVVIGYSFFPKLANAESKEDLLPQELECPIHYWHEVRNQTDFENYIWGLRQLDFHPVSLRDLYQYFSKGEKVWGEREKPIAITFDDGLRSQYENAVPILRKWRIRATFACLPDFQDGGAHKYMSNEQMREVAQDWEAASHTFNHRSLPALRGENLGSWQANIVRSKERLEEITGKEVVSLVYPYGQFDEETVKVASQYYKIAVKTGGGIILRSEEIFKLPRQRMS